MCVVLRGMGLLEIVPILHSHSIFRVRGDAPTCRSSAVALAFESFIFAALREDRKLQQQLLNDNGQVRQQSNSGRNAGHVNSSSSSARKGQGYPSSSQQGQQSNRVRAGSDSNVPHLAAATANIGGNNYNSRHAEQQFQQAVPSSGQHSERNEEQGDSLTISTPDDAAAGAAPLSLDELRGLPPSQGLQRVLSLFDGQAVVREVLGALDPPLQRHGVDILVFLLRYLSYRRCQHIVVL